MQADALTFARADLAWLLLLVAVLVIWAAAQHSGRHRLLARLGTGAAVKRLMASFSPGVAALRIGLIGLALVLLVGAASRPRYGLRETEVSNAGIDLAIVVDASKSMLVRDVVPNRIQGTMLEISSLLDRLAGGRVALVPFAGIPFVQAPLTTDHDVIRTYLADLKPEDLPVGGTNVGRAITLAVEVLTGEKEKAEAELRDNLMPQFKGSKHKAIVLFSDGEDHEGGALEAAQKAAAQGIRIYTVGVGSAFGDPVPILGPDGTATGILKDEAGQPIFSKLDLPLLEKVAAATGGKSFHYADRSVAQPLAAALDALEKAEYTAQFQALGEDRYQYLLGPALLLLLIDAALSNRRRRKRDPASVKASPAARPVKAAIALVFAALTLGMFAPSQAQAVPAWLQRENPDIADGRELLKEGKLGDAVEAFRAAQASRPEHVVIWFNLGVAQAYMGLNEDAATSLGRALGGLRTREPTLEADIHYATGTNQLEWARKLEKQAAAAPKPNPGPGKAPGAGSIPGTPPAPGTAPGAAGGAGSDPNAPQTVPAPPSAAQALAHYREAVKSLELALVADPTRLDTRRNLEIARLGAWPSCRTRDKAYEPNDQVDQATPVAMPEGQREQTLDLRSCPEDRDLFRMDLQPGDRFSAKIAPKADTSTEAQQEDGAAGSPAQLGLTLLSSNGQEQLRGPAAGAPPLDAVDLGRVDHAEQVLVDVRNIAEVESAYELKVKLLPACNRIEDKFEPNDTPAAARSAPVGEPVKGRLCPLNDDNYSVLLSSGQGLRIRAKTTVDMGANQVDITVLDPSGQVVARARQGKEGMVARLASAVTAGAYVVQIQGGLDTEADYELALEILPPCSERDDVYEDNDQAVQANPLTPENFSAPMQGLYLCPGDDDWYQVELKQGESLFVDLTSQVEDLPDAQDLAGSLTVEVYDEHGELWGQAIGSAVSGGGEVARTTAVLAPPPGKYRVRVTGGGVAKPTWPLPTLPPGSVQVAPAAPDPQAPQGLPPGAAPGVPPPGPGPGQQPPQVQTVQVQMPQGLPAMPGFAPGGGPGAAPGGNAGPGAGMVPGAGGPPPPNAPVAHVILPPGLPSPAVDPAVARLDLPYVLKLRILPPCPEGNDEFEPNDEPGAAKPIELGQEQLLRICKGDRDWMQVTQKAGQNLQISARYDLSHGPLEMEVMDEAGAKSIAKGVVTAPGGKKAGPASVDDTPQARKGRTATTAAAVPGGKTDRILKVRTQAGADVENFYLLRVDEPPPPSEDQQQKQDQNDKKDDKDKDDKDKKDQDKKDKGQPPPEEKDQKPDPKKEEQERTHQQMDRNDHNPDNLEAQEALRNSQFRNTAPAKDW
ncbi:MAG: VWA domain-containing protein [Myxococcota bacterium]